MDVDDDHIRLLPGFPDSLVEQLRVNGTEHAGFRLRGALGQLGPFHTGTAEEGDPQSVEVEELRF